MHEATLFGALATISSPKCCHYSGFQEHAVRSNSLNLSTMVRRDDDTCTQNVSTWQRLCLKLFVATLKNGISKLARFSGTLTFIAASRRKSTFLISVLWYTDCRFDVSIRRPWLFQLLPSGCQRSD